MTRTSPPAKPMSGSSADAEGRNQGGGGGGTANASPSEIAREALRQLAVKRVPPTPDNYRELYYQISGSIADEAFPVRALKAIASSLPRSTPESLRLAQQFERGVASGQWPALKQAVLALCEGRDSEQRQWSPLIRELTQQLERRHLGITQARKRDALEHVLGTNAAADQLHMRLSALVRSWSQTEDDPAVKLAAPVADKLSAASGVADKDISGKALTALLNKVLTRGIVALAGNNQQLANEAQAIAAALGAVSPGHDLAPLIEQVDHLLARAEWEGEERQTIRAALLNLLHLIIDNIRELVIDDSWLHGQLSVISEVFVNPLDIRLLDEVEHRLRDVIQKQGHLKRQLSDAQQRLKSMLAGFIDQLSAFSATTGDYELVLGRSADRIAQAKDISELSDVIDEILRETHNTRESAIRSGEELSSLREQVSSANQHILRLQRELDETSEMVRHDPLTGALNRKGLDEALAREISRMRRLGTSLCLSLLDIDNFKQINDQHGHVVGDDALRHLAGVIRDTLRPQDAVARYGGEEFLILLPETDLDQANAILVRLQRELTRRFFLANEQRLLITFSAGVACLDPDEDPLIAIDRADKAMYTAKRAGKNRVINAL